MSMTRKRNKKWVPLSIHNGTVSDYKCILSHYILFHNKICHKYTTIIMFIIVNFEIQNILT